MAAGAKTEGFKISITADSSQAAKEGKQLVKEFGKSAAKMMEQFQKVTVAGKEATAMLKAYNRNFEKTPDLVKGMNAALRTVQKQMNQFADTMKDVNKAVKGLPTALEKVQQPAKQTAQRIEDVNKANKKVKESSTSALKTIKDYVKAFLAFEAVKMVVMGLVRVIGTLINTASQLEQWGFQLRAIYEGSVDSAEKAMRWVREFAATTPHETQNVVKAFVYLKGAGVAASEAVMQAIGNASYAMGKEIEDTVTGYVSLETETLRRLGIVVERVGRYAKIASGDMRVNVINDIDAIRESIIGIWEKRFPTAMKDAAKTFKGSMSRIRSYAYEFLMMSVEEGFFRKLTGVLDALGTRLGQLWDSGKIHEYADVAGTLMARMALKIGRVLQALIEVMPKLIYFATLLGSVLNKGVIQPLEFLSSVIATTLGAEYKSVESKIGELERRKKALEERQTITVPAIATAVGLVPEREIKVSQQAAQAALQTIESELNSLRSTNADVTGDWSEQWEKSTRVVREAFDKALTDMEGAIAHHSPLIKKEAILPMSSVQETREHIDEIIAEWEGASKSLETTSMSGDVIMKQLEMSNATDFIRKGNPRAVSEFTKMLIELYDTATTNDDTKKAIGECTLNMIKEGIDYTKRTGLTGTDSMSALDFTTTLMESLEVADTRMYDEWNSKLMPFFEAGAQAGEDGMFYFQDRMTVVQQALQEMFKGVLGRIVTETLKASDAFQVKANEAQGQLFSRAKNIFIANAEDASAAITAYDKWVETKGKGIKSKVASMLEMEKGAQQAQAYDNLVIQENYGLNTLQEGLQTAKQERKKVKEFMEEKEGIYEDLRRTFAEAKQLEAPQEATAALQDLFDKAFDINITNTKEKAAAVKKDATDLMSDMKEYSKLLIDFRKSIDEGTLSQSAEEKALIGVNEKYDDKLRIIEKLAKMYPEWNMEILKAAWSEAKAAEQARIFADAHKKLQDEIRSTNPLLSDTQKNLEKLTVEYENSLEAASRMAESGFGADAVQLAIENTQLYINKLQNLQQDYYANMGSAYRELFVDSITSATEKGFDLMKSVGEKMKKWATSLAAEMAAGWAAQNLFGFKPEEVKAMGLGDYKKNPLYMILGKLGIVEPNADVNAIEQKKLQAQQMMNQLIQLTAQLQIDAAVENTDRIVDAIYDTAQQQLDGYVDASSKPTASEGVLGGVKQVKELSNNLNALTELIQNGDFSSVSSGFDSVVNAASKTSYGSQISQLKDLSKLPATIKKLGVDVISLFSGSSPAVTSAPAPQVVSGSGELLSASDLAFQDTFVSTVTEGGELIGTSADVAAKGLETAAGAAEGFTQTLGSAMSSISSVIPYVGWAMAALGAGKSGYGTFRSNQKMGMNKTQAGWDAVWGEEGVFGDIFGAFGLRQWYDTIMNDMFQVDNWFGGQSDKASAKRNMHRSQMYAKSLGNTDAINNAQSLTEMAGNVGWVNNSNAVASVLSKEYGLGIENNPNIDILFELADSVDQFKNVIEKFGETATYTVAAFKDFELQIEKMNAMSGAWSKTARVAVELWDNAYKKALELQLKALDQESAQGKGTLGGTMAKYNEIIDDKKAVAVKEYESALARLTNKTMPMLIGELQLGRDMLKANAQAMNDMRLEEERVQYTTTILLSDMELTTAQLAALQQGMLDVELIDMAKQMGLVDVKIKAINTGLTGWNNKWTQTAQALKGFRTSLAAAAEELNRYGDYIDLGDDVKQFYADVMYATAVVEQLSNAMATLADPELWTKLATGIEEANLALVNAQLAELSQSLLTLGTTLEGMGDKAEKYKILSALKDLGGFATDLGKVLMALQLATEVLMFVGQGIGFALQAAVKAFPVVDTIVQQFIKGFTKVADWVETNLAPRIGAALKRGLENFSAVIYPDSKDTTLREMGLGGMTTAEAGAAAGQSIRSLKEQEYINKFGRAVGKDVIPFANSVDTMVDALDALASRRKELERLPLINQDKIAMLDMAAEALVTEFIVTLRNQANEQIDALQEQIDTLDMNPVQKQMHTLMQTYYDRIALLDAEVEVMVDKMGVSDTWAREQLGTDTQKENFRVAALYEAEYTAYELLQALADETNTMGMSSFQKSLYDWRNTLNDTLDSTGAIDDALGEFGGTANVTTQALAMLNTQLQKMYLDFISPLMQTAAKAGMTSNESSAYDIGYNAAQQTADMTQWTQDALALYGIQNPEPVDKNSPEWKKWDAGYQEILQMGIDAGTYISDAANAQMEALKKQMDKQKKELVQSWQELNIKSVLDDLRTSLYDLNKWYGEQSKLAYELGQDISELNDSYDAQRKKIIDDYFDPIIDALKEKTKSLFYSDYNLITPVAKGTEQKASLEALFADIQTAFQAGNAQDFKEAVDKYTAESDNYLKMMQDTYASGPKYIEAFNMVTSAISMIQTMTEQMKEAILATGPEERTAASTEAIDANTKPENIAAAMAAGMAQYDFETKFEDALGEYFPLKPDKPTLMTLDVAEYYNDMSEMLKKVLGSENTSVCDWLEQIYYAISGESPTGSAGTGDGTLGDRPHPLSPTDLNPVDEATSGGYAGRTVGTPKPDVASDFGIIKFSLSDINAEALASRLSLQTITNSIQSQLYPSMSAMLQKMDVQNVTLSNIEYNTAPLSGQLEELRLGLKSLKVAVENMKVEVNVNNLQKAVKR